MPQQFQAVRCYNCSTFQVQQVKKVQIFFCAVCGEKQTIQHIYAISNAAKDIRLHVQRLNTGTAAIEQAEEAAAWQRLHQVQENEQLDGAHPGRQVESASARAAACDWTVYADDAGPGHADDVDDGQCDGLVTVLPDGKRGRAVRGGQSRPCKQRRTGAAEVSMRPWEDDGDNGPPQRTAAQAHHQHRYSRGNLGRPVLQRDGGSSGGLPRQHHQHGQQQSSQPEFQPQPELHSPFSSPRSGARNPFSVPPAPQRQLSQQHQTQVLTTYPRFGGPPSSSVGASAQQGAALQQQHPQQQPPWPLQPLQQQQQPWPQHQQHQRQHDQNPRQHQQQRQRPPAPLNQPGPSNASGATTARPPDVAAVIGVRAPLRAAAADAAVNQAPKSFHPAAVSEGGHRAMSWQSGKQPGLPQSQPPSKGSFEAGGKPGLRAPAGAAGACATAGLGPQPCTDVYGQRAGALRQQPAAATAGAKAAGASGGGLWTEFEEEGGHGEWGGADVDGPDEAGFVTCL
ncbi:hypothetical protein PLESTM_001261100 [Pleodorina starrii]|nr:hypothetical protein PLESTM_001261100 [Pleodorina starrii]